MRRAVAGLAVVVATAAATWLALALWHRSTAPEPLAMEIPSPQEARRELRQRLDELRRPPPGAAGPREVVLREDDLVRLAVLALAEHEDGRRLLDAVTGLEAELDDGRLGLLLALDPRRLDELELDRRERALLDGAAKALPLIGGSDLVLGLEGRPRAVAGEIAFGPESRVRIALLELELASLARRLGRDPEELGDKLRLRLPGARVESLAVHSGELRLRLAG